MIDIAVLEAMAAAGANVEMILAAVRAAQEKHLKKLTDRRAKDAERKRRSRAVRNGHAESRGPSDVVCDPPQHIPPQEKKEPKKVLSSTRAHLLPEGWKPKDYEPSDDYELDKMTDWARSKAIKRADWDATFRNWKRNARERTNGSGNHTPRANGRGRANGHGGDFAAGIAKAAAAIIGDGALAGPAREEVPFGRVNIDGD